MNLTTLLGGLLALFITLVLATLLRLRHILSRPPPPKNRKRGAKDTHILIVLGSGGHTAEMFRMLRNSGIQLEDFGKRTWVASSGDGLSAERAKEHEEEKQAGGSWDIQIVSRAREIHQPLYTAPISCLRCAWDCVRVLTQAGYPDVILCNGPATATILVFTSVVLRFLGFGEGKMRTVYVESWARVKNASLSGMLLSAVVERFLVQWPQLEKVMGRRTEFGGVLVG